MGLWNGLWRRGVRLNARSGGGERVLAPSLPPGTGSEEDERGRSSAEGGERAEGSRGCRAGREVQRRWQLLPELRQGPYHTPLESPPWHPCQDL